MARLTSAAIGIPIIASAVWFGDIWLTTFVVIVGCVGLIELFKLFERSGRYPYKILGLLWLCSFVVNAHFQAIMPVGVLVLGFSILLIFCCLSISLRFTFYRNSNISITPVDIIRGAVMTLLGVIYLGWTLSLFIILRQGPNGFEWIALTLVSTFSADTGALAIGSAIGTHKMIPSVSSGKTWEGAFGGLILGIAATTTLAILLNLPVGYWEVAVLGTIIGIISQVGDLFESKIKRLASVKDSGIIIPGHGGVLDRLDSIVFVVVVVYYFAGWAV